MIELAAVSARAPSDRGRSRPVLTNVSLKAGAGVLAIIGAPADGATLLLDLIDGTVAPKSGRIVVLGASRVHGVRARIARVSLDAPLPEALRVDEVCVLSAELRGEPSTPARDRLAVLGVENLAERRVATLSAEERRTVSLAIALGSKAEVLLLDEPLAVLDPVAPRLAIDALRARAKVACIIATTTSARDAAVLADQVGILDRGGYAPFSRDLLHADGGGGAAVRLVVGPSRGNAGGAALIAALSADDKVSRVETVTYRESLVIVVHGQGLPSLARAVTRAIATSRVDVELVEPATQPLDAIRAALVASAASGGADKPALANAKAAAREVAP